MRSTDEPDEPKEVPMEIPIDDNPNEFFRDQTSPEKDLQFECQIFLMKICYLKAKFLTLSRPGSGNTLWTGRGPLWP